MTIYLRVPGVVVILLAAMLLSIQAAHAQAFQQYQFNNGLQAQSIPLGGGVRQYSFSDGTTGQSVDLGGGVRQYNFSNGLQGQRIESLNGYRDIGIGIKPRR